MLRCWRLVNKIPWFAARCAYHAGRCQVTENDVSWRLRLAPPGFGKIAVERGRRRSSDRGPTRDPLGRKIKQRDDVETGDKHAVARAHCGDELAAVFCYH